MKHTIRVIEEDIKKGQPGSCNGIALSLKHYKDILYKETNDTMVRINEQSGKIDIYVDEKNFRVNDMQLGYVGEDYL